MRVKIQLADNIKRVITFESAATIGARLGTDLFMPNGQIGTPASVLQWLGGALPGQSSGGGNSGIPVGNYLTTKGDLLTRDTQVQRLPIGATGQMLRVAAGLPAWESPAALTKVDDTNVTLTLTGAPGTALLAAAGLTLGWTGELAATRGGTGRAAYVPGDMLYADTDESLETVGAGPDGWVLTMYGGFPDWQPPPSGDPNATYLTEDDESMFLPNSRRVLAGTNVTFDDSVPNVRTINATGGGGGSVSITAGTGLVATPSPITGTGAISLDTVLAAYAGGDTPSAFTLGIVDSTDAAAWRAAIGAGTSTVTPAALTKTDDTNVTLTLGGTPTTALLQEASLTLGWTGQLGPTRGGTGIGTYTTGDILYASAANVLSKLAVGSNGNVLTLAAGVPTWAAASGSSPLTTKGDVFGYSTTNDRIPVGTNGQVLTADSAQALGVKWAAPAAGTAGNPTAVVGLAAVNGSATTYMRSDGAPPIDQGIAPTWTSQHIFANILRIHSAAPQYIMKETDAGSDLKEWICYANSAVLTYGVMNDAESVIKNYLQITRSAGAPATMIYGNSVDYPTHTFQGTPTFNVKSGGTFTVNMFTNGALFESPSGNNARIKVSTLDASGNLADIRFATNGTDRAYVGVPLNGGSFFIGGTANALCLRGDVAVQFGVSTLLSGTLDSAGRWYFPQIHNNGSGATGTTPMVASGTYTPTGTNVANAGSLSMSVAQWMRVGNVVTVSGSFTFTAAGTATTTVGISLPIASALASAGQLAGSAAREETAGVFAASVITDATNDRAQVQLGAIVAAAACTVHYTFTYVVV